MTHKDLMADGLADELGQRLGEGSDGVGEGGVGGAG